MKGANGKRLIEVAFPLKQASIDSVHEKSACRAEMAPAALPPAPRSTP
jgi:hypothetical protein